MASVYPFAPHRPADPEIRKLWNEIRLARKPHVLKCGCTIKPGIRYHSVGVLVNGRFTVLKQHVFGCLELLH